jgi:threonine/homoserine/homoserine lactone efflux protein
VPHIVAAITGLAALLNASATAFQIIKYAGAAYLVYMAVMTLRDKGALEVEIDETPKSPLQVIRTGIVINILNPKLTIFTFLPQFIRPGTQHATLQLMLLSLVFMLITFLVFAFYGRFAVMFRERIIGRSKAIRTMRHTFAGMFVALAGVLAFSDV